MSSPLSKLHQKVTLLLRAPSTSSEDVLQDHLRLDSEAVRDVSDTVWTEGTPNGVSYRLPDILKRQPSSLCIDVGDLSASSTLILWKLGRNAERMAKLGLRV